MEMISALTKSSVWEGRKLPFSPSEPPVPLRQGGLGTRKRPRRVRCMLAVSTNVHNINVT